MSNPICFNEQHTNVECGPDHIDQLNAELDRIHNNQIFLRDLFNMTQIGQGLYLCDVEIEDALVGQPVYLDPVSHTFKPARITTSIVNSVSRVGPEADVWGVVAQRYGDNLGTILIAGVGTIDLTASLGASRAKGTLYLTEVAGSLATSPGTVVIPVLTSAGDGRVLMRTVAPELYDRYKIRRITLSTQPAGSAAAVNGKYKFDSQDPSVPGWLPVSHSIFQGKAPYGAKFGYNVPLNLDVADALTNSRLDLARIEWDKGGPDSAGASIATDQIVRIDNNGIWWMSDCETQVPWAEVPASGTSCPISFKPSLNLITTQLIAADVVAGVSSLVSLSPLLRVYRRGTTQEASTGELEMSLDFSLALGPETGDTSALAVKGLDSKGQLTRGPIVHTVALSGDAVSSPQLSDGVYSAKIDTTVGSQLSPQRVALLGSAIEDSYLPTMGITLGRGHDSGFRAMYQLPGEGRSEIYLIQHAIWALGDAAATLPAIALKLRVLGPPDPKALWPESTQAPVGVWDDDDVFSNQYLTHRGGVFEAMAGSVVIMEVNRNAAGGDDYPGSLTVLKQMLRVLDARNYSAADPVRTAETLVADSVTADAHGPLYS